MMQYIIILLDDTSVSFCHYANSQQKRHLMPLTTLKTGITYAMKENLNIQFVYPSYELPKEYLEAIDSIDHTDIKPCKAGARADVVVIDGLEQADNCTFARNVSYVLRTTKQDLFARTQDICTILNNVERLNVTITDAEGFSDADFEEYEKVLGTLSQEVEKNYTSGNAIQLNLLTDRMMLDKMKIGRAHV